MVCVWYRYGMGVIIVILRLLWLCLSLAGIKKQGLITKCLERNTIINYYRVCLSFFVCFFFSLSSVFFYLNFIFFIYKLQLLFHIDVFVGFHFHSILSKVNESTRE